MVRICKGIVAGMLLAFAGVVNPAQAAERVGVRLLADVEGVQPGEAFRVGVRLTMAPSWHVYWINPGDAGQTVTATLTVPSGFSVSPWAYPVPVKFVQPGNLLAYGYDQEVMLIATVTPPKDLDENKEMTITANVKYLVCDENACLPGKEEAVIRLPVRQRAEPANRGLFADWAARLPAGRQEAERVADVKVQGKVGERMTIALKWKGEPAGAVEFFPGKSATVLVEDVKVETEGRQSHISFDTRVLAGQQPDVPALASVVAYTDRQGRRRGIEVAVPTETR